MGGGRKASEGSVISEMRCVAAQPRQMEYSYLCDQPTGFTMALQPRASTFLLLLGKMLLIKRRVSRRGRKQRVLHGIFSSANRF